jgi:hypothetical protein
LIGGDRKLREQRARIRARSRHRRRVPRLVLPDLKMLNLRLTFPHRRGFFSEIHRANAGILL